MSKETMIDLENAIRAHIEDEGEEGDLVTHWVLIMGLMPEISGDTPIWIEHSEGQPQYIAIGLAVDGLSKMTQA